METGKWKCVEACEFRTAEKKRGLRRHWLGVLIARLQVLDSAYKFIADTAE